VLYFAHANFIPSSASQIIMCANKWKNRSKTLEKIFKVDNFAQLVQSSLSIFTQAKVSVKVTNLQRNFKRN